MTAARTTKAAMELALDAVQARGLTVASIEIKPDGTIRIETPVAGIVPLHLDHGRFQNIAVNGLPKSL